MDGVERVRLAIGLPLYKEHLLGEAVGSVALLRVARPEVFFLERDRRELGVGADGAYGDELLHPMEARLFHDLHAHEDVVMEELARSLPVQSDPATLDGCVDDDLWAGGPVHTYYLCERGAS